MSRKIDACKKIPRPTVPDAGSNLDTKMKLGLGRLTGAVLVFVGIALMGATVLHAATLEGQVLRQNRQPAANVNVDIIGPISIFTKTDREGTFQVTVPAGTYVIRVRDGGRRMRFSRSINDTPREVILRLTW